MKVAVVILVVIVASAHAFFLPTGGAGTTNSQGLTGQANNPLANNAYMGSMNINLMRQMLLSIIPKILANPALRAAFTGQPADGAGPSPPAAVAPAPAPGPGSYNPPPPSPLSPYAYPAPANTAPAGNMYPPVPPAGNMYPPVPPAGNMYPPMPSAGGMGVPMGPPMGSPMGLGGPGYFAPGSDKLKEMQIMDLLHDPEVGLITDPTIGPHIPPRSIYGFSMPDTMKDFVQHALLRRQHTRALTVKENTLMHLIGDPPSMSYFPPAGAGYGRPGMVG